MLKEAIQFAQVPIAIWYGASRPYPEELKRVADQRVCPTPSENYAIDTADLLPNFEQILSARPVVLGKLPHKASVLAFNVAFSDQHALPLTLHVSPKDSEELATRVMEKAEKLGRPVPVPEILEIALDISKNNLSEAVVNSAVTTRHYARAHDYRLLQIKLNPKIMERWKWATADDMGVDKPDTAGDLYHFYVGVLSGLVRTSNPATIYDLATCKLNDYLCHQTAGATQILRYGVCRRTGEVHDIADLAGYEIGRAMRGKLDNPN